jgi:DNA-binding cell septation regulator SpoVG
MDATIAATLFDALIVTIDRVKAHVKSNPKVEMLGFVDVSLTIPTCAGFAFKLRNLEVKILNGKPRIDTPSEKGSDGKWYPIYFPLSAETRAVLTAKVFAVQEVSNWVAEAAQRRSNSGATNTQSESNPFAGNEQAASIEAPPVSNSNASEVAKHLADAGFTPEQVAKAVAEL